MKQTKIWFAIVGVLVLIAVIMSAYRERDDAKLLNQLLREQASKSSDRSDPQSGSSAKGQTALTQRVQAERDELTGLWDISQATNQELSIRLPFDPAKSLDDHTLQEIPAKSSAGFIGVSGCVDCHAEKVQGFIATSHANTSRYPIDSTEMDIQPPRDSVRLPTEEVKVVLNRSENQFQQQLIMSDWTLTLPMNIATGSGKSGKTFLYWHGNSLYQSYGSFYTQANCWFPSPGYSESLIDYSRPIRNECLECHITYIESVRPPNRYHPETLIAGITCERCHGPGESHATYHTNHPLESDAHSIVDPRDLSRERQLDICGQCHLGAFKLKGPAFAFRPGDDLSDFHQILNPNVDGGGIHTSNQLVRLQLSQCFVESQMSCTTCHNPHQFQRGNYAAFARACLKCHTEQDCGLTTSLGAGITEHCSQCHMPRSDNRDMQDLGFTSVEFTTTDHFIRKDDKTARTLPSDRSRQ